MSDPLKHLLWKDERSIRSLTLAIAIGIVGLNLLAVLAGAILRDQGARWGTALGAWFLMPNLFALGVGPMLVGNEEETGTLNWLRSLPISWKTVTTSKLITAIASLMALWCTSSVFMGLHLASLDGIPARFKADFASPEVATAVLYFLFYSLLILLCGFVSIFLVRSPVGAVVLSLPLILVVHLVAMYSVERICSTNGYYTPKTLNELNSGQFASVILFGLFVLAGLTAATFGLAKRRLSGSRKIRWKPKSNQPVYSYRPTIHVRLAKPSIAWALAWQQFRHMAPLAIPIVVLVWIAIFYSVMEGSRGHSLNQAVKPMAMLCIALGITSLGGMTFYNDSLRRQVAFFADRGISAAKVWGSRLAVSACFVFLCWGPICVAAYFETPTEIVSAVFPYAYLTFLVLMAWSVGALISMSARRPILAFFGAAVAFPILLYPLAFYWVVYPSYVYVLGIVIPIFLLTTFRLCRRWIDGEMGWGFHLRALGWIGIAFAVPSIIVFGHRWISMPGQPTEIRRQLYSQNLPSQPNRSSTMLLPWSTKIESGAFAFNRYTNIDTTIAVPVYAGFYDPVNRPAGDINAETIDRFDAELTEEDPVGIYVSFKDLFQTLQTNASFRNQRIVASQIDFSKVKIYPTESSRKAIEVLLSWSRRTRELVVSGDEGMSTLIKVAESADRLAIDVLTAWPGESWKRDAISKIPSDELRHESRRIAIASQWRLYDDGEWTGAFASPRTFAGASVLNPTCAWLGIEQKRADRKLAIAVNRLIEEATSKESLIRNTEGVGEVHFSDSYESFKEVSLGPLSRGGISMQRYSKNGPFISWLARFPATDKKLKELRELAVESGASQ